MAEPCSHDGCKREAEVAMMVQFSCGDATVKALLDLRLCPQHGALFSPERLLQRGYASFLKRHFEQLGLPRPALESLSCRPAPLDAL